MVGPIKTKTAYVEWTGIAKTNENTDKLISGLERIDHLSIDRAAKALYQDLKEQLGAKNIQKLTPHQRDSAITPQRIGNCSIQSGNAALKAIDIEANRKFMSKMRAEQIAIGKHWVADNPSLLETSTDMELLNTLDLLLNQKQE